MLTLNDLVRCYICYTALLPNPFFYNSETVYCPEHGDFFVQRLRGRKPKVIFRAFGDTHFKQKPPPRPSEGMKTGRPGHIIRCNQTGVIFPSIKAAVSEMKLQGNMNRHLRGVTRHIKGYSFTKFEDPNDIPPFVPVPRIETGTRRTNTG